MSFGSWDEMPPKAESEATTADAGGAKSEGGGLLLTIRKSPRPDQLRPMVIDMAFTSGLWLRVTPANLELLNRLYSVYCAYTGWLSEKVLAQSAYNAGTQPYLQPPAALQPCLHLQPTVSQNFSRPNKIERNASKMGTTASVLSKRLTDSQLGASIVGGGLDTTLQQATFRYVQCVL